MIAHRRIMAAVVCALAACIAIVPAVPAPAADAGTELWVGWAILDGRVRCPGSTAPRHMSSNHAAAFIQSWYIATIYGTLTAENPPKSLPVCIFKANDRINGQPYTFTAFYATDGKKAWVGLPRQVIGPGAFVPKEKWFIAPPRATPAFKGELDIVPTGLASTTTTTTNTAPQTAPHKSAGDATGWIFAIGVIAVAIILTVILATRGRSRRARGSSRAR